MPWVRQARKKKPRNKAESEIESAGSALHADINFLNRSLQCLGLSKGVSQRLRYHPDFANVR